MRAILLAAVVTMFAGPARADFVEYVFTDTFGVNRGALIFSAPPASPNEGWSTDDGRTVLLFEVNGHISDPPFIGEFETVVSFDGLGLDSGGIQGSFARSPLSAGFSPDPGGDSVYDGGGPYFGNWTLSNTDVPEPSSLAMGLMAVAGIGIARLRRPRH